MKNAWMCFTVSDPPSEPLVTFCSSPVNVVMMVDKETAVQEGKIRFEEHPNDPRKDKVYCGKCGQEMRAIHAST